MNTAVLVIGIVGLLVGVLIGWLVATTRVAGQLAAARARADAMREAQAIAERSLASASADAAHRQSSAIGANVAQIVDPLRMTLTRLGEELRRVEDNRISAYAGVTEQVRGMRHVSAQLDERTRRLSDALHTPHLRGRWGELQLERVVELAGLSRHCDFSTQVTATSAATGPIRPDLVVHLAGGRNVVVDAKVPLHAYLDAVACDAPATERSLLADHARAVRAHVGELSGKRYWAAFSDTPEFVVLFLPSDPVLEAALRADPDLLEFAITRNVVLATPSTLVALLRTVALGWRHEAMARDAASIHELGTELHHRIAGVLGHLDRMGRSLSKTVEAFNSTVGSVESRVGVTARKLADLEAIASSEDPVGPTTIDTPVRRTNTAVDARARVDARETVDSREVAEATE